MKYCRTQFAPLEIIVAVDEQGGFGKSGKIPWKIPEDFKHFKKTTHGHICVMGRRTHADLLANHTNKKKTKATDGIKEILPGRESFVLTSDPTYCAQGATVKAGLRDVVQSLDASDNRIIFVLGGYRLFIEALAWARVIHMTVVKGVYDCDVFFPVHTLKHKWEITSGRETDKCYYVTYSKTNQWT